MSDRVKLGKNRGNLVGRVFAESKNDGFRYYGKLYVFQNGKCVFQLIRFIT